MGITETDMEDDPKPNVGSKRIRPNDTIKGRRINYLLKKL